MFQRKRDKEDKTKSFTLCKIWGFIFSSSQHRSLTSLLRILQIDDMGVGKLVRHRVLAKEKKTQKYLKIGEHMIK